jgi:Zn-dependent protease with chaperone function
MTPSTHQHAAAQLLMQYFDGRHTKATSVRVAVSGASVQIISAADGSLLRTELCKDIDWPERTRHGMRSAELPNSGQLISTDLAAYDAWASAWLPRSESWVVKAQQSWRGMLAVLALLVVFVGAAYQWGLPVAARGITALVPVSVDEAIGRNALAQIDGKWMKPSKLPVATQERLKTRFDASMKAAYPQGVPNYQLLFRASEIGPNAFALPGGAMVMTDELVNLVKDDEVVMGVMGHEIGHVTLRHGMRQLVQLGVMQVALTVAFGDYGSLITAAPLILGSMAYSRNAEREADDHAIQFMQANGISPLVMVKFFSTMRAEQRSKEQSKDEPSPLDISIISSHPADAERMDKFKNASR